MVLSREVAMAGQENQQDPSIDRAREEADGQEVFGAGDGPAAALRQAEDAQGIEAFEDPDTAVPRSALVEGTEGEETLTGAELAPTWDDDYPEDAG